MKVKDLISLLEKEDPNNLIFYQNYDGSLVTPNIIIERFVKAKDYFEDIELVLSESGTKSTILL